MTKNIFPTVPSDFMFSTERGRMFFADGTVRDHNGTLLNYQWQLKDGRLYYCPNDKSILENIDKDIWFNEDIQLAYQHYLSELIVQ